MEKRNNNGLHPVPPGKGREVDVFRDRVPAVDEPYAFSYGEWEEEELDIRQYLAVLLRRKWVILAVVSVVLFTSVLYVFTQVPLYKATATVEISSVKPNVTPFRDSYGRPQYWYQARDFIESQIDVLKSRALALKVVERLDLENHPEYFQVPKKRFSFLNPITLAGKVVGWVRRMVGGVLNTIFATQERFPNRISGRGGSLERTPLSEKERLAQMIREGLEARPIRRGSNVIAISFVSPRPDVAAKIVNATVEEFVRLDMERNIEAARLGKVYLEKEIAKVQARLEDSEEKLNDFAKKNDIVFLNKIASAGQGEDLITAKLANTINELSQVHAKRLQLESLYQQSLKDPDSLPQVRNDAMLSSLKQELATLESKYANLSATFTKEYPAVKSLISQIQAVKKEIANEKKRVLDSIKAQYMAVLKQEELLKKSLENQKKMASELKRKAIDYNILKREVETNRRIYEMLLQRAKEMEVQAGAVISSIKPVDFADIPLVPFSPRKGRALLLSLIVGLMAGVFLAFFLEYLDNTIKSPDEVERLLRLPVLGVVPTISVKRKKKEKESDSTGRLVDFYALNSPKSPAAEAFRMVRTSLMLASAGQPPETVLVTSPQMGGGKTLVALNLAAAFAQMEEKVILIDCDLRKARLHRVLDVKANPGLSNYLAGRVDLAKVIHGLDGRLGDGMKMDFISAGTVPPNPVELLNSKTFVQLLEYLKEEYDHIVLDSPPLMGFADSLVLSRVVDGTVLVLRNQKTPRPAARYARDRIFQVGGYILGVVVNDVQVERGSYYYYGKYSGYYYYSYYGKYGYGSPPELPGKS